MATDVKRIDAASSKPHKTARSPVREVVFVTGGLFLLVTLFAFRSVSDLDYGIHVATGRWILDNSRVPTTDPFSWSFAHHSYIAYHWGFQVLMAFFERLLGTLGPVLLKTFVILLTAAAVTRSMVLRCVNPSIALGCGILASIVAEWRFTIRPEIFTNLLLALTVLALDMRRLGSRRSLYLIPVIFVVWINTHIYVLGFAVLGCEIAAQIYSKKLDRGLILATLVGIAALFCNPYGTEAILEPLRLFTRMQSSNLFAQHILELQSPIVIPDGAQDTGSINNSILAWGALLALAIPAAVGLYVTRRTADLLVLVLFAGLSTFAIRNLSLFVITALPALVTGLTVMVARLPRHFDRYQRALLALTALSLAILLFRVGSGSWFHAGRRPLHFTPQLEKTELAVEAAQFISEKNLLGRGFNNLNVGGTLMLLAPKHKVFIDGRNEVTGEEFFARYLEIGHPSQFPSFAEREQIEYIVLSHRNMMPLIRSLVSSPVWKVVHFDSVAIVLVRREGPNGALPEASFPQPLPNRSASFNNLLWLEVRASVVDSFSRWLLGSEELAYDPSQRGVFLLTLDRWAEAEPLLLEAALRSPHFWETSYNLGALYTRLRFWEGAAFVYRTVLMLNPSNELARIRATESFNNYLLSPAEET